MDIIKQPMKPKKKSEVKNMLKKNIVIKNNDTCEDIQNFEIFASVDLSRIKIWYQL